MFDLGWQELFIIGTVTLIVVGPKDLPKLLNKVGKVFGKIKQVSREFYDQINETAEIEEINNLKNNLNKHTDFENYINDPDISVGVKKSGKVKIKKVAFNFPKNLMVAWLSIIINEKRAKKTGWNRVI